MRRMIFLAAAIFLTVAFASGANAQPQPGGANLTPKASQEPFKLVAEAALDAPGKGGGVINIGQAFGTVAQPYIDAIFNAMILAGVSYLGLVLKQRFGITIDQGNRDALTKFLENSAASLVADGAVKMQGTKITVSDAAMAAEANTALSRIPGALAHFGIDGPTAQKIIEAKILDAIPQTAAGAQIVAAAHAAAPATAETAKPAA